MPKITFEMDVPQPVTLRFLEGKAVDSSFPPGSTQYQFSAEEGVFYLSDTAGPLFMQRCKTLGVKVGETIQVTRTRVTSRNSARGVIEWIPTRGTVGEQPNGTYAVPAPAPRPMAVAPKPVEEAPSALEQQLAASIREVETRKAAAKATQMTPAQEFTARLVNEASALVDAYAQVLDRASKQYGNAVKADDLRSILLSVYINQSKRAAA